MEAPKHDLAKKRYGILETFFHDTAFKALNDLEPCERLFAYFMSNAAICGYPITVTQFCPYPNVIHEIYRVLKELPADSKWKIELETYWIYLFCNYGVHFIWGFQNNKKLPKDMGLSLDRPALESLGVKLTGTEWKYLLDPDFFPTGKVEGNIEKSGNNFHGPEMTTEIYENLLPAAKKRKLNAYHRVVKTSGKVHVSTESYSVLGRCSTYLQNCLYWVRLGLELAKNNPNHFDSHCVSSLESLIKYVETGEESHFKEHSKSWAQMKNRVEYNWGFIEYYDDPMGQIGTFQGDVTVKCQNLDSLMQRLPIYEARFPFPREWKREDMKKLPNAANAYKTMGIGTLGPIHRVSAYCLPNYTDLRSQFGSKQVIYSHPPPSNLEKYKKIYLSKAEAMFFERVSPDLALESAIKSLTTTLHETIGHASGALYYHDDEDGSTYSQINQLKSNNFHQV